MGNDHYYPATAPRPGNGLVYKWEINGYYKNSVRNETLPVFGVIPFRGAKELGSLRCGDLYPIMFGTGDPGSGCGYVQFHNEPQVIRCKSCFQSFDKADLLRVFGGIQGLTIFADTPYYR